jgi:hypothetical protein
MRIDLDLDMSDANKVFQFQTKKSDAEQWFFNFKPRRVMPSS